MQFYQSLEYLVLGSRLRRLSESFLADINAVYKQHKIKFDAAWFPVFYILSQQQTISIKDIADTLGISHSAASQITTSLQAKGLLKMVTAKDDGRKKIITFTAKGNKLLEQVQPIWQALQQAMDEIAGTGNNKILLKALTEMEDNLQEETLFTRIEKRLK